MRELETLNITATCFHVGILWYTKSGGSIMCKARPWGMGTDESGFLCVWMGSRPWQGGKSTKCLLIRMTKDWISWPWVEVYKRAVCLCVSCLRIMSFALFSDFDSVFRLLEVLRKKNDVRDVCNIALWSSTLFLNTRYCWILFLHTNFLQTPLNSCHIISRKHLISAPL